MGFSRRPRRWLGSAAAAGVALWLAAAPAMASGFRLDPSLPAVTGLAADATQKLYWTAPASGGTAIALRPDGSVAGKLTYGASPIDVQAVSYRDGRLWIGDIGDANATRSTVVVYRIGDPKVGGKLPYRSYSFSYPDGPQDARAMAISRSGRVYLVTRGAHPGIYRSSASLTSGGFRNSLLRVSDAPANVTDATFSADGTKLVLRTLTTVHVLDPYTFKATGTATLPAADEGEAITVPLDGNGLLVTGQGSPVPVDQIAQPTVLAPVDPAPATPEPATPSASGPASGAPSATGTPPAAPDDAAAATAPRSNLGGILSLVAAGLIAAASAAVVVLRR